MTNAIAAAIQVLHPMKRLMLPQFGPRLRLAKQLLQLNHNRRQLQQRQQL